MIRATLMLIAMSQACFAEPLRIGITEVYPPFIMQAADGRLSGLDIDLLTDICARGGYECSYEMMPLNDLLKAVAAGRVDVAAGGIGNSVERDRILDFTCPYAVFESYSGSFLAMRSDVDLKSASIAVTKDSLFEKVLKKGGYHVVPYDSETQGIVATMGGATDAYFGMLGSLSNVPGAERLLLTVGTLEMPPSGATFVVAQGARGLQKDLNDHLAALSAQGRINALASEWLDMPQGDVIATCQTDFLMS